MFKTSLDSLAPSLPPSCCFLPRACFQKVVHWPKGRDIPAGNQRGWYKKFWRASAQCKRDQRDSGSQDSRGISRACWCCPLTYRSVCLQCKLSPLIYARCVCVATSLRCGSRADGMRVWLISTLSQPQQSGASWENRQDFYVCRMQEHNTAIQHRTDCRDGRSTTETKLRIRFIFKIKNKPQFWDRLSYFTAMPATTAVHTTLRTRTI